MFRITFLPIQYCTKPLNTPLKIYKLKQELKTYVSTHRTNPFPNRLHHLGLPTCGFLCPNKRIHNIRRMYDSPNKRYKNFSLMFTASKACNYLYQKYIKEVKLWITYFLFVTFFEYGSKTS